MIEKFTREELELIKKELKALEKIKVLKSTVTEEPFSKLKMAFIDCPHAANEIERALGIIADYVCGVYSTSSRYQNRTKVRRDNKLPNNKVQAYLDAMEDLVDVILYHYENNSDERVWK